MEGCAPGNGECGIWETRASTCEWGKGIRRKNGEGAVSTWQPGSGPERDRVTWAGGKVEGSLHQEDLNNNHHMSEGIEKGFNKPGELCVCVGGGDL